MYFKPWVGIRYRSSEQRLWILAESHYDNKGIQEKTRNYTIETVKTYAISEPLRFFRMVASAITGERYSCVDMDIFNQWAFSNFVQDLLLESRVAPTNEQWQRGGRAFGEQLDYLQPTHLLVCGYRLWNGWLPEFNGEPADGGKLGEVRGRAVTWGTYSAPLGNRVRAMGMIHPSAAFSPSAWHQMIGAFLAL